MRKQSFTLLEVLVVLALLMLFLPVVLYPLRQTAKDIQLDSEERQLAKAVHFALAQFFVKMHQEPISFDSLQESPVIPIPFEWFMGTIPDNAVSGTYRIRKVKKEKESEDPEFSIQLWEVIFLLKTGSMKEGEGMEFSYEFITRRKTPEKAAAS